jgi:hypothetical protein
VNIQLYLLRTRFALQKRMNFKTLSIAILVSATLAALTSMPLTTSSSAAQKENPITTTTTTTEEVISEKGKVLGTIVTTTTTTKSCITPGQGEQTPEGLEPREGEDPCPGNDEHGPQYVCEKTITVQRFNNEGNPIGEPTRTTQSC